MEIQSQDTSIYAQGVLTFETPFVMEKGGIVQDYFLQKWKYTITLVLCII